jgi:hypothetical protein
MIMKNLLLALVVAAPLGATPLARPGVHQDPQGTASQASAGLPPMMLRLKTGDILFGSIVSHEPETLTFRRLDNDGVVQLAWSFLDPVEEGELRLRFGYVESQAEELTTDAERVVLADGTEIVGLIVNRTADHLWFKRAEGTIPIEKRRLRGGSTRVQVPALDIFTKEELYQQRAFDLQGALLLDGNAGARAHDDLAQFAERLFDYPHAVEHYRTVQRLEPDFETTRISTALARSEQKAALQEQVDVLAQIDLMRARGRYDKALALIETFPELYPDTPLLEDWNKLRERVAKYQERDLRAEIVRRVHYRSVRLAREAAREYPTFEEVMGYLDEQMGEDVLEAVKQDVQRIAPGIENDQVRRLWDERKGGRRRQASFGIGTWLLGEDRALAQYEDEGEEQEQEPEVGSAAASRKKLEDRVQRYLKNQELARRGGGGASDEEDPNELWNRWIHSGRYQWILAHFAEFSGYFNVENVRFSFCRECGGTGTRTVLFTGSAISGKSASETIVPCGTCHTLGHVRRIRYR